MLKTHTSNVIDVTTNDTVASFQTLSFNNFDDAKYRFSFDHDNNANIDASSDVYSKSIQLPILIMARRNR